MSLHVTIVGVRELRGKLSEYLSRVSAGENFDVVSRGRKIAELRTPRTVAELRKPGAMKGKIWMADDFDTWPEDIAGTFDADVFPR